MYIKPSFSRHSTDANSHLYRLFFYYINCLSAANPEAQVLTEPEMVIKNYYKSIAENKDVAKFVMMLSSAVSSLKGDVLEALQRYSDYAFLWEKDKQEAVMV